MSEQKEALFNTVMLLEDDSSHALIIKRALKGLATNVCHYTSVAEVLAAIKTSRPDLIISDLHLGAESALPHLPVMREQSDDCPIVVLTASTSLVDAVEAMKQGAKDFIVKNFDRDFAEVLAFALSRLHVAIVLEAERRALQAQIETLRVAIENSQDGLAVVNHAGQIIYANSAFHRFVERCGGVSRDVLSIFSDRVKGHMHVIETLKDQMSMLLPGAISNTEILLAQERDVAFDLSLTVVRGEAGSGAALDREYVVWVRETSELKRRQRFQREVLSTTTHDLKGPLSAIMTSAELIPQFKDNPEKVNQIALRVGSSARTAMSLIDEFLSARRIQEGNMVLHPVEHDLAEVTSEAIEDYRTMCKARSIELSFEGAAGVHRGIIDKLAVGRVVGNLVGNAIKFTPKGGKVTVAVSSSADELHLRVQDTGSGMDQAEAQKLFGRFSRLERHNEIAGTGLGLFVVKSIVGAHGGKIGVTSTLGRGTRFDITFPKNPPVNERGELICVDI